jgi:DnaJ-class molecular chaperone
VNALRIMCPTCGGAGQVAVDRFAIELGNPRTGTGLVRQVCPTCDDEGWLDTR